MPHTTTWESKGIKWRFYGSVTTQEVNDANKELYDDPRFDLVDYFLWDMSDVETLVRDKADDNEPAATDLGASYTNDRIRGALVARKGEVYDSCDSYIKLSKELNNPWEMRLFTDDSRAWAWLQEIGGVTPL